MKCKDVIGILEGLAPVSAALDWDNPGLLAGRMDKEVRTVYLCVDATDEVVRDAIAAGADMLISHHPLIFGSVRKINSETFVGRRLIDLIGHDISYYAMHTNFDVCGMAQYSAEILGLQDCTVLEVTTEIEGRPEGIGRIGGLGRVMSLEECAMLVKERFDIDNVKVFGALNSPIETVAISPGAGKSMIDAALSGDVDLLITGDIDHHTGIDAVASGITVIDAGHYGIEKIFIPFMEKYLKEKSDLNVICDKPRQPFVIL
ncbi:MAG: Nif3-like dinuclear metal center hexameric protein [Lachnospiraceae bacterium]|nr:Nif3-like dinuclear metal center hexameric protein [Lachnospiraceae bacterium]